MEKVNTRCLKLKEKLHKEKTRTRISVTFSLVCSKWCIRVCALWYFLYGFFLSVKFGILYIHRYNYLKWIIIVVCRVGREWEKCEQKYSQVQCIQVGPRWNSLVHVRTYLCTCVRVPRNIIKEEFDSNLTWFLAPEWSHTLGDLTRHVGPIYTGWFDLALHIALCSKDFFYNLFWCVQVHVWG